ncbi:hypothetical protein F5Y16DRAFT_212211 [Xylariaceae sp. FL0255]|nr:hypothetical protein F5Y16DRAFT_212211 [Xylariaceae sp. FL0255]
MTVDEPQNNYPEMLKALPEADLIPGSIEPAYFTPSLDEIKEKCSQLNQATVVHDDVSSNAADGSFPRSSIQDILPPEHSRIKLLPGLADYLSSKFASEGQDAYVDAQRMGDTRGGMDALKRLLGRLDSISKHDGVGATGIMHQIEVLGSLERDEDARALLDSLRTALSRSYELLPTTPVHILRRAESDTTHAAKRARKEHQDTLYEEEYRKAHHNRIMLDAATWSQDWKLAAELAAQEAQRQQIDSAFFQNHSLKSFEKRFERVRHYLNMGLQHEHSGYGANNDQVRSQHLEAALNLYSEGCSLMDIHREHLEDPEAMLTSHDHSDSSNLFFSAARVCIYFHQNNFNTAPEVFPRLKEQDWAHQALYFLERGKARALLRSIERYSETNFPERKKVTFKELALEAWRMVSANKAFAPSSGEALSTPLPLSEAAIIERLRLRHSWKHTIIKAQSIAAGQLTRWWEAPLDDMLSAIPSDALIIEYGLVQGKYPGIETMLMSSAGIIPTWKQMRITPILERISGLKDLIESAPVIRLDQRAHRLNSLITDAVRYLADELLSPFLPALREKKQLFIVPSGALANIPWALLLTSLDLSGQNPSVSLIPSFRIWYGLHKLSQSKPTTTKMPSATIICNSPQLPDGSDRDIKFSRIEAMYIARKHGTWPVLADTTTREAFVARCQQSTIIHLSSHGTFNEDSPMQSNIDVFKEPLTPLDLSGLAMTANLVVFSSCLSAYSRAFDSGTALSFAHALLGSGACAFVGTLWVTGDVPSLVFMVLFYKKMMIDGLTPSAALADAQKRMREFTPECKKEVVDDLLVLFNTEAARRGGITQIEQYVINYRYWIDHQLRRYNVADLRSPWSWAGFVLIGYGEGQAYALQPK